MTTTNGGGGDSGAVGSERSEYYEVEGVRYGVHPAARLFPPIEGEEFKALVEDIEENGLREPVLVQNQEIVDGRNRLRAARAAGVPVRFEVVGDETDVYALVASANLHRRHLKTSQRAMIAARLVELSSKARELRVRPEATEQAHRGPDTDSGSTDVGASDGLASGMAQAPSSGRPVSQPGVAPETKRASDPHTRASGGESPSEQLSLFPPAMSEEVERQRRPPGSEAFTQEKAAAVLNIGRRTVARAAGIAKDAPDLEQPILDGTLTLGDADTIRKLPQETRKQAVDAVKKGESRTAKRAVQSATPVVRTGTPGSVPAEVLSPPAVMKAVRLALGNIDLDPCSSEAAQKKVQATTWYGEEDDGLSQPWKGAVHVFPPLDLAHAFALKLKLGLDSGSVNRASLLAPIDVREDWLDHLLAHERLSVVVIDHCRLEYPLSGTMGRWTPDGRMALCLFGVEEPSAELLTELRWGHVLFAKGSARATGPRDQAVGRRPRGSSHGPGHSAKSHSQ